MLRLPSKGCSTLAHIWPKNISFMQCNCPRLLYAFLIHPLNGLMLMPVQIKCSDILMCRPIKCASASGPIPAQCVLACR